MRYTDKAEYIYGTRPNQIWEKNIERDRKRKRVQRAVMQINNCMFCVRMQSVIYHSDGYLVDQHPNYLHLLKVLHNQ